MNTLKTLIVVSQLALAAGAYAADVEQPAPLPQSQVAGKTRAQVVAELREARAAGLVWSQEATAPVQQAADSSLTRTQVWAELQQARRQGLVSTGDLDYPPAS
ncbi:DUF4148 domain-containing protein [Bordetella petrii]|uniref:DUF4148 domain-containing protein n=1 Tax=Bordetella petrii TaxID=94624 RepID=UPI001A97AFB7|nr:DUF4148 domain-containing protein [Bordetella petrii]MBO1114052.1 DUF4148 domain-containing protein [Bordetella petrii]